MKKAVLYITVVALSMAVSAIYADETINLSTRYPSPKGNYKVLKLVPRAAGDVPVCDASNAGLIFFDEDPDKQIFQICTKDSDGNYNWGDFGGGAGLGLWERNEDTPGSEFLYPLNPADYVGVGTSTPEFMLDVDGGIFAKGTYSGAEGALTTTGAGTRMIWYPQRAAFRAGQVTGDEWDDNSPTNNIGNYSVAFGLNNKASGEYSAIGGGENNTASSSHTVVGGGIHNKATGDYSTVSGGHTSEVSVGAQGNYSTISGGGSARAGEYATITGGSCGGNFPHADGEYAVISGGMANEASQQFATVRGGSTNKATAEYATISGGFLNNATGGYSTVSGGHINEALAEGATVCGGSSNDASGKYSTVGGGESNIASGDYSVVTGGARQTASGYESTVVGGGAWATAGGRRSVVLNFGTTSGELSLISFPNATLDENADRTFAWGMAQSTPSQIISTPDAFILFNSGFDIKVGIGTLTPWYALDVAGDIHTTGDLYQQDYQYPYPDYVFESDYNLMSIKDLKNYVSINKHLPNVQSSEEMSRDGIKAFKQNKVLLEKIEEAHLYIFELEDRIAKLEEEVGGMEK